MQNGSGMEFAERLAKERRARLAAERLLEQKSRELFAANEKLAMHARSLSDQIVEQRQVVKSALTEAEVLKGQQSRFVEDLDRAHTAAVMAERLQRLQAALGVSQLAFNQLGDRRLAREVRLDSGDVRLGFVLALIALFELDERTFHGWNVPVQLAKDIVG